MGNDAGPRPGYDHWISFRGQGRLVDPEFNENGRSQRVEGYVTDLLNERAVAFVEKKRDRPFSLFLAHKAVHPDLFQKDDGTIDTASFGGYVPAERHRNLYRDCHFPPRPNVIPMSEVLKNKPVFREAFEIKAEPLSQRYLAALHAGTQEEIRLRAAMMASVDEGVGMIFDALQRTNQLDDTLILFLGDNGYFFGEHGLGPERRFAYEEGIHSPFIIRYPRLIAPGTEITSLVLTLDIAPTLTELAGGHIGESVQGRSLLPLFSGDTRPWRSSFLVEYFSENAFPWLIGMTYKAIRTERHKLIHWVQKDGVDELYDLAADPYELNNVFELPEYSSLREELRSELARLVAQAVGL
jgi:arylsulfatase A-like enzyme